MLLCIMYECFRCGFNSDGHDTVYDRLRTRLIPWLGMLSRTDVLTSTILLNKQLFPFRTTSFVCDVFYTSHCSIFDLVGYSDFHVELYNTL